MIEAHLHVVNVASVQVEAHLAPSGAWWERVDPAAEAILERVHTAGVERAVLVQAIAAHGYDCSYLLSNARPGVALVGAVDPFGPDPVAALDTLADAGIDGLRLFSIRSPRPWLAGDVGRALVARCVERRVRPSVCVLPNEISALVELASAFPEVAGGIASCSAPRFCLMLASSFCLRSKATSGAAAEPDPNIS